MSLTQALKTIPAHLEYFLKVVNEHSLQSPFVYEFYANLKQLISKEGGIEEIEAIRRKFLTDATPVTGTDMGAGSKVSTSKTIAKIARHGISTKRECVMLASLVKMFNPYIIVELGTSLGIATAYLAGANNKGTVFTFEGNKELVDIAGKVSERLSMKNIRFFHGNIDDTLPGVLNELEKVDMAIIDANHRGEALWRYFHWLKEKMSKAGLMVIDDIRWSAGMYRAWKEIINDEKVTLSMDFHKRGLLFFDSHLNKEHYVLSL